MPATLRIVRRVATALVVGMCAIGVATGQAPPASDEAMPRIETSSAAATDRAIEQRLRGIFAELDGLEDVQIQVEDGVVKLTGETLYADARERAVRLARQVQGVVEVDDGIQEVRDVRRRIAPAFDRLVQRAVDLVTWLPLVAVAVLVIVCFWIIGWAVGRWDAPFRRIARNQFLAELLQQIVRGAIVIAGVLVALDILDATTLVGTVLGAAGVIGLAFGFAMRDTVENYIASLLLSLRQPFDRDDLVVIEGWEGRVLRLTSRATLLMTLDGNHVRIPNSIVYKSVIVNYTRNPGRRFQFDVGIANEEDLSAVQRLGAETLRRMQGVLDDPAPVATVEALGDSSVVVRLSGWVDQRSADFLKVRSEAIRLVKQAYDAAGVSMPEPTYNLRLPASSSPAEDAEVAPLAGAVQGPADAIDIAPRDDLGAQIVNDRGEAEEDLLSSNAPKE